eukprot:365431-Chlamydomonas_euryale.AAC.31
MARTRRTSLKEEGKSSPSPSPGVGPRRSSRLAIRDDGTLSQSIVSQAWADNSVVFVEKPSVALKPVLSGSAFVAACADGPNSEPRSSSSGVSGLWSLLPEEVRNILGLALACVYGVALRSSP